MASSNKSPISLFCPSVEAGRSLRSTNACGHHDRPFPWPAFTNGAGFCALGVLQGAAASTAAGYPHALNAVACR
jgi:hypothetical protein